MQQLIQETGNIVLLKDLSNISQAGKKGKTRNDLDETVQVLMEKYGKYHDSTPYKLWVLGNRHKLVSSLYSGATVEVYSDEKKHFKGLFFSRR